MDLPSLFDKKLKYPNVHDEHETIEEFPIKLKNFAETLQWSQSLALKNPTQHQSQLQLLQNMFRRKMKYDQESFLLGARVRHSVYLNKKGVTVIIPGRTYSAWNTMGSNLRYMLLRDTAKEVDISKHDHTLTLAAAKEFGVKVNYVQLYDSERDFWHKRLQINGIKQDGKSFIHAACNGLYLRPYAFSKFVTNYVRPMQTQVNKLAKIYKDANDWCPVLPGKKEKPHTMFSRKKHVMEKMAQSAGKDVLRKYGVKYMIGLHDGIIIKNWKLVTDKVLKEMAINCKAITNINHEWKIKSLHPRQTTDASLNKL